MLMSRDLPPRIIIIKENSWKTVLCNGIQNVSFQNNSYFKNTLSNVIITVKGTQPYTKQWSGFNSCTSFLFSPTLKFIFWAKDALDYLHIFVKTELLFCGYKRYRKQTCRSNLTIYIYSSYTVDEFKFRDMRKKRHLNYKNYPPLFLDTKYLHIHKIISILMQELNLSSLLRQFEKMWVPMWKTILCSYHCNHNLFCYMHYHNLGST